MTIPEPEADLITRWDVRDARYARRRIHGVLSPLTDREQELILTYRRREAQELAGRARAIALTVLSQWRPPAVVTRTGRPT